MAGPDPFQAEVARLALAVARDHGFALAGGHALIAHGLVSRPTEDIDPFTDESGGIAREASSTRSATCGSSATDPR